MKRINEIVKLCGCAENISDIGTDHGYTIIELIKKNKADSFYACDINMGPLSNAKENINEFLDKNTSKYDNIKVRYILSDGLKALDKNTNTAYIVTGLGCMTICDILTDIDSYCFPYLIVSPQSELEKFEIYIKSKNLKCVNKEIVFDSEKYYFIYKFIKSYVSKTNKDYFFPLPQDKTLYKKYLEFLYEKYNKIINSIDKNNPKYIEMEEKILENRRLYSLF